ncbi:MAG: sigma-54-dependent Fis family transcriptional regulator [Deltaproteobacteria bacterium]|nr:sigma-54-dependent Fis family transcriptional regulator [Candidatus Anaeroferrophillus wilburensis]MBN2889373.1 sigma-54-dependent Fis family transcriptional regulator [Deltaproteobacteria bacterium]
MSKKRILLIDNEEGLCRMMEAVLSGSGYMVKAYTSPREAVMEFQTNQWDLVISDIKMPGMDGLEVLQRIKEKDANLPVIMITAYATVETSIKALRKGAYDMLTKPFEPEELLYRVKNALKQTQLLEENHELKKKLAGTCSFDNIIGSSQSLKKILETVRKIAVRDLSVLISGESGTGKELIAKAIHHHSQRSGQRFMAINCGALPESVLESELFGYKKGAFTGANTDRKGIIEAADGGTLFLDEVGNLSMNVQKTLLRALQEREFMRIGDVFPTRVDVRLISATNTDLLNQVESGTFREDLYYRLNVVNIHLPPLRERHEDIPLLATHFIREQNQKFGTAVQGFSPEAMKMLIDFPWPGNIRQLSNVIEACMAVEIGKQISVPVLSQFLSGNDSQGAAKADVQQGPDYSSSLTRFETEYLIKLLRATDGNIEEAARQAGVNLATIYRKLKKYRIEREDYC